VVTSRPSEMGWALGLSLVLAVGCSGPTQVELVELEIGTPADTILTRYINVPVATWLGGSRWVVVAGELSEAALVGFDGTGLQVLGGTGEAELRGPFAVYRWGDTAWVADWATRRVTGWSAEGRFVGSVAPPDLFRGTLPRARDAAGQFYFEIAPIQGPGGRGSRVPGLWGGRDSGRHLDGKAVEGGGEGSVRRAGVRPGYGGDVRVAVAKVRR